jgi:hypothetical protein
MPVSYFIRDFLARFWTPLPSACERSDEAGRGVCRGAALASLCAYTIKEIVESGEQRTDDRPALALPLPSSFRDLAGRGHIVATTSKWDWLASFDFIRPNRVEDSVFLHGFEPLHFFLNDKS